MLGQVANLGFPVVVSFYLLVRVEAKLEHLATSIVELAKAIERIKSSELQG
ncbi:MAG: YvrJ family protein [Bacillota bacterium]